MTDPLFEPIPEKKNKVGEKQLSGLEKAVVFFRFLGADEIQSVLRFLDRSDVEKISHHMTKIDAINQEDLIRTINEFRRESAGVFSPGSAEEKAKFFLEKFDEIQMEFSPEGKIRSKLTNLFSLEKLAPEKIIELFKNDHNQVIAVVLSQLSTRLAKDVLTLLPPEKKDDILQRIAMLKNLDQDALKNIDNALKLKLSNVGDASGSNGPQIAANILSLFPETESKIFMDNVQQKHKPLYDKINKHYLTFADIVALPKNDLQKILATVEPQILAQAICKLPKESKDICFAVITKRAVTLIEDELKSLENALPAVVQDAQQTIIKNARQLEADRKIDLSKK